MSTKFALAAAASIAACLPLVPTEALAVSQNTAKQVCINTAAVKHNALRGNVQVRRARPHSAGYEFGLVIDGAQFNCIISKSGKIRYLG